jgi:hypothetical protein
LVNDPLSASVLRGNRKPGYRRLQVTDAGKIGAHADHMQ